MTATRMRARQASDALTRALLTLASQGGRTNCSDPTSHHLWTSEHQGERAIAAMLCRGCPVGRECGEAAEANDERHGVWNGVDRTVHPGRARQRNGEAA
jgi:Transcription factor WhiB